MCSSLRYDGANKLDIMHISSALLSIVIRVLCFLAYFNLFGEKDTNGTTITADKKNLTDDLTSADGMMMMKNESDVLAVPWLKATPLIPDVNDVLGPPDVDGLTYTFRVAVSFWTICQVLLLKRLMSAFAAVGELMASLTQMLSKVRRVIVPVVLVLAAAVVNFRLFGTADDAWAPIFRFIGSENSDAYAQQRPMVMIITIIYTLFFDILILNLMIAIMTDTYFKVRRHATA